MLDISIIPEIAPDYKCSMPVSLKFLFLSHEIECIKDAPVIFSSFIDAYNASKVRYAKDFLYLSHVIPLLVEEEIKNNNIPLASNFNLIEDIIIEALINIKFSNKNIADALVKTFPSYLYYDGIKDNLYGKHIMYMRSKIMENPFYCKPRLRSFSIYNSLHQVITKPAFSFDDSAPDNEKFMVNSIMYLNGKYSCISPLIVNLDGHDLYQISDFLSLLDREINARNITTEDECRDFYNNFDWNDWHENFNRNGYDPA